RLALGYDAASNVTTRLHANGLRETLTYDAQNRLHGIVFDRGSVDPKMPVLGVTSETFLYDGLGRLVHAENDISKVDVTFDSFGHPIQESQLIDGGPTLTVRRAFDFLSNRIRLEYPSGRSLSFNYDLASRLVGIEDTARGTPNVGVPGNGVRR